MLGCGSGCADWPNRLFWLEPVGVVGAEPPDSERGGVAAPGIIIMAAAARASWLRSTVGGSDGQEGGRGGHETGPSAEVQELWPLSSDAVRSHFSLAAAAA